MSRISGTDSSRKPYDTYIFLAKKYSVTGNDFADNLNLNF